MRPEPLIVVIGAGGMLGRALLSVLRARGLRHEGLTRRELDLARLETIDPALARLRPTAVINAASFTDVNAAELPERREEAFRINRDAAGSIAGACARLGVPLAHVSTDYVFDGRRRRPYREDDPTGALQVYGLSKLEGEGVVRDEHPAALVARTSTLYGPGERERPHYVDAILRQAERRDELSVVELPVSSPTSTPDLALALLDLLERGASGIVHTVNDGWCSRLELARAIVEESGHAGRVRIAVRPDPGSGPARPAFSALDTSRLAALLGRPMRPWREALRSYLRGARE